MRRAIVLILACLLTIGCDQSPSATSSSGSPATEAVRTTAGGEPEQVALTEVSDQNALDGSAQQLAADGYKCDSVSRLWKLAFTKDVGMIILKVRCSDGTDYQLTLFDNKGFAKPWTGVLLGQ